jgi:ABC-2 type transport system ATP-binding protein
MNPLKAASEHLAITLQDLRKDFAGEKALKGLTLSVPTGSLFGLIGADGAGKSTLLRILATLLDPDGGKVEVLGRDPGREFAALRHRIGYMPQRFSLYADLSVQENMEFFATLFGLTTAERLDRIERLLGFAQLADFKSRRAGALSGGMKQKLALSCILLHEPELLLLDEPTVGVDPVARRDFWRLLHDLRAQGRTLIVSTPYMDEAELCSSLALLHQGRLLALGTPVELTRQFPLPLVSISADKPLRWPLSRPCPSGVRAIYSMGGNLHALLDTSSPGNADASNQGATILARVLPPGCRFEAAMPGLEDVFLGLLSGAIPSETFALSPGLAQSTSQVKSL